MLLDDTDMFARSEGKGYKYFGLDPEGGAVVAVRPDGYIGFIAPLEGVEDLMGYFDRFLTRRAQ